MEGLHESERPREGERVLGDFRLRKEIGRGGMGIVYEAVQISLGRRVAVKILPAQLTLDKQSLERFHREALITASLYHPAIIDIHAIGDAEGVHFMAMELVEGTSLAAIISRLRVESFEPQGLAGAAEATGAAPAVKAAKPHVPHTEVFSVHSWVEERDSGGLEGNGAGLSGDESTLELAGGFHAQDLAADEAPAPTRTATATSSYVQRNYIQWAVRLIADVADALHHAHDAGVIHRDVKPSNILVREEGSPVLLDFGLARQEGMTGVTMTGEFAGTPNYMSPEQAQARWDRVDHRTDVFSLGATLYELLTLHRAFEGESPPRVLSAIISKEPPAPQKLNPGLANDLVTVVLKALEKDPDRRYSTAAELAADLRAFLEYRPIQARRATALDRVRRFVRREPLKAALALALGIGAPLVGGLWWQSHSRGRALAAAEFELRGVRLEDRLEAGFLALGDLGRHARAEEVFTDILRDHPDSYEAVAGLARSLIERGGSQRALDLIEEHAREGSDSAGLERVRVDALRAVGREDEALAVEAELPPPRTAIELFLEGFRLLRATPVTTRPTTRSSSLIASRPGRDDAARAVGLLSRAIIRSKNQRALFHFVRAWAVWGSGETWLAEEVALTIQEFWPDRDASWFYSGLVLEGVDPERALACYDHAETLTPDFFPALARRAPFLLEIGRVDEAVAAYERVLEVEPDYPIAHANLAVCHYERGAYDDAVDAARRAIELDPSIALVYDTLGTVLVALERFDEAREAFAAGVELAPDNANLRNDLGWSLQCLGRADEALAQYDAALRLDPDLARAHQNRGKLLAGRGDLDAALESFLAAADADPEWPEPWACVSEIHGVRQEWNDAIDACWLALDADDTQAVLYLNLARTLCNAGELGTSLEHYDRAIELDPGLYDAYDKRLLALKLLGEHEAALAAAKAWTEAFPGDVQAWNNLAWLQVDPAGFPELRDPAAGLEAAQRASELSDHESVQALDTLAWALFGSGRADEALETGRKALALAENGEPGLVGEVRRSLAAFEAERPGSGSAGP